MLLKNSAENQNENLVCTHAEIHRRNETKQKIKMKTLSACMQKPIGEMKRNGETKAVDGGPVTNIATEHNTQSISHSDSELYIIMIKLK